MISVIIPVYNASKFLAETLASVSGQTLAAAFEVVLFDDGSTDDSLAICEQWQTEMAVQRPDMRVVVSHNDESGGGAGNSRNEAIARSRGEYLCLLDSDDVMHPRRLDLQLATTRALEDRLLAAREDSTATAAEDTEADAAVEEPAKKKQKTTDNGSGGSGLEEEEDEKETEEKENQQQEEGGGKGKEGRPLVLMGANFTRVPEGSTERYTDWCNGLDVPACAREEEDCKNQVDARYTLMSHRFKECTLICPTWFFHRDTWLTVGKFTKALGEDLDWFYRFVEAGGTLSKVGEPDLLVYRYHDTNLSHGIDKRLLANIRIKAFERQILTKGSLYYDARWAEGGFAIWGAGKTGKYFYKHLSPEHQAKVKCFLEIPKKKGNKIGTCYVDGSIPREGQRKIPIVHWNSINESKLPFLSCVAMQRGKGEFEDNLDSLQAVPMRDYILFG